eukprot:508898-Prorocentrum_lima.AAC.1
MPRVPLRAPSVGSMSRALRISLGASDFSLIGATHGMKRCPHPSSAGGPLSKCICALEDQ